MSILKSPLQIAAMAIFVSGAAAGGIALPLLWAEIITQAGLWIAVPIIGLVALQFALIMIWEESTNPILKSIATSLAIVTALFGPFEGLMLLVLIFYIIGAIFYDAPLEITPTFSEDFVIGTVALSCMIYGACGAVAVSAAKHWFPRLVASSYIIITLPCAGITLFLLSDQISVLNNDSPRLLMAGAIAYLMLASALVVPMMLLNDRFETTAS